MDATLLTAPLVPDPQVGRALPKIGTVKDERAARKTAVEFEAVFLSQMLGHMFEGIKTDGMFGGGHAERVYRSLLMDEYGKAVARNGGIGIADQVMTEILRQQESRNRQ